MSWTFCAVQRDKHRLKTNRAMCSVRIPDLSRAARHKPGTQCIVNFLLPYGLKDSIFPKYGKSRTSIPTSLQTLLNSSRQCHFCRIFLANKRAVMQDHINKQCKFTMTATQPHKLPLLPCDPAAWLNPNPSQTHLELRHPGSRFQCSANSGLHFQFAEFVFCRDRGRVLDLEHAYTKFEMVNYF